MAPCHTAQEGEICYDHILWALEDGFDDHPDWYPGLTKGSTFEEFQEVLYTGGHWSCPPPCGIEPAARTRIVDAMSGVVHVVKNTANRVRNAASTHLTPHVRNSISTLKA